MHKLKRQLEDALNTARQIKQDNPRTTDNPLDHVEHLVANAVEQEVSHLLTMIDLHFPTQKNARSQTGRFTIHGG